jgi:putative oxygen-independent coproporphyrinogen III oxidase
LSLLPGLYLHIPFCLTKCHYCDFYSSTAYSHVGAFITALEHEMRLNRTCHPLFDTLYLGGGTPSLLAAPVLSNIFDKISKYFSLTADAEITLEANPDDVTAAKLRLWQELGVNRLSLGVQSLNDAELHFLGRRHTADQARQAVILARAAGFSNLSVDLIYAVPGQTEADWLTTLQAVLEFEPEHLSCYQLTIEKNTPLGKKQALGEIKPMAEEPQRSFFLRTSKLLQTQGYRHYEISNFARGEHHIARHNTKYWQQVPYLGLGPAAHSFDGLTRRWNVASVSEYCHLLGEGRAPVAGAELLTPTQRRLEALCLGLRTSQGVALTTLTHFPQARQTLANLCAAGLLTMEQEWARPTPEGFLVADSLALMLSE